STPIPGLPTVQVRGDCQTATFSVDPGPSTGTYSLGVLGRDPVSDAPLTWAWGNLAYQVVRLTVTSTGSPQSQTTDFVVERWRVCPAIATPVVPEPGTLLLFITGLAALGATACRKRRRP